MKHLIIFILTFIIYLPVFAQNNYKSQSVLASGNWIKVSATERGMHKITYSQLREWGINQPANVSIYNNGGYMLPEMNNVHSPDDLTKINAIHSKDNNGNDAVFFYSTGPIEWKYNKNNSHFEHTLQHYSEKNYFYITDNNAKSLAPPQKQIPVEASETKINYYDEYQVYHQNKINIHKSGNLWYSDRILPNSSKSVSFDFAHPINRKKGSITISATNASTGISKYFINLNSEPFDTINLASRSKEAAKPQKSIFHFNPSSSLTLDMSFSITSSTGDSWLHYIEVNLLSKLTHTTNQLIFRNKEALDYNTLSYTIETNADNPILWDISSPLEPKNIAFNKNGNQLVFTDRGGAVSEYILFDPKNNTIHEIDFEEKVENQNIHGLPAYNMIIVSHNKFIDAAETLAEFHRQTDQMKVLVVDVEKIYNEFSSGKFDPAAIRNMVKMFYERGINTETPLKYLLLMGAGSFNNHLHDGSVDNYIPTYQSGIIGIGSTLTYVSDDFFAILGNNDGALDGDLSIGVGRIPCSSLDDAKTVVEKNLHYYTPETFGNWRNLITFAADDEDRNEHMQYSERLIQLIDENFPGFIFDKVYFDAFQQTKTSGGNFYPDAKKAVLNRIEEGTLIFNYIGHANETAMSHERVLEISDVLSMSNSDRLPVFVTATCKFSPYDKEGKSIGEEILFNKTGGAIALFTTTRDVYGSQNFELSRIFYQNIFTLDDNGENLRMGDLIRIAKNHVSGYSSYNKRSFALLGNPALKMAYPTHDVKTISINNKPLSDSITVGALELVNIEAQVTDINGNLIENYQGKATTMVYDKEIDIQTLANDGGQAFNFPIRNNIIYKGISSVVDGKFSTSFVIPKDILYNIDKGKIFYYISNDDHDGNGATDEFYIGGSAENQIIDDTPPQIDVYLNNRNFKSGDDVSSSALLLVDFSDESGINTLGQGIGHDIIAVIDNDHSNPIVLNDYYSSQIDTYQKGTVMFPLNNLSPGEHFISIKAWDVSNNSSTKQISFFVEEGFKIHSVTNTPNPVDFYTVFNISHNLPGDAFEITVEIFNLRGYKVAEITDNAGSYNSTSATIRWDSNNTLTPIYTDKILIYRVTMRNQTGLKATGSGKLLLKNY